MFNGLNWVRYFIILNSDDVVYRFQIRNEVFTSFIISVGLVAHCTTSDKQDVEEGNSVTIALSLLFLLFIYLTVLFLPLFIVRQYVS